MSTRFPLSESDRGQPIQITQGASPGQLIHQVPANRRDQITLVLTNRNAGDQQVSLEVGTQAAAQTVQYTIPANDTLLVDLPFAVEGGGGGLSIWAFSTSQSDVSVMGSIERE